MDLDFNALRELVAALNQTDIAELTLKSDQFELTLRKHVGLGAAIGPTPAAALPLSPSATPVSSSAVAAAPIIDSNLIEITSPMVGTFYRSSAPDEPAFVEVGDRIQPGQTVCIIEAMKLMNELEAEEAGEIVEILVNNAEPVEFGQPLMRVKPL